MEKVLLLVIMRKNKRGRTPGDVQEEMRELIYSSKGNVIESMVISVEKPSPAHFLRKGKLLEVKECVGRCKPHVVITNIDLSPIQLRNLEEFFNVKVVDRSGLILDIFAQHAKSRDGKLQVELAQYTYLLPRLSVIWEKLSRLGGGIGTRGPGEQILERDRRKIRKHITRLNKEIKRLRTHRELIHSSRKRKGAWIASIVGYTNAGKSTLLRQLTGANILVQDKLFATLDPVTRRFTMPNEKTILFTDTVGFLFDLPHGLIKAFHSTLEEINEADLVLIIMDGSNREYALHYDVVQKTLKEVGAEKSRQMIICNKVDMMTKTETDAFARDFPSAVFISAKNNSGFDTLIQSIGREMDAYEHKNNIAQTL